MEALDWVLDQLVKNQKSPEQLQQELNAALRYLGELAAKANKRQECVR